MNELPSGQSLNSLALILSAAVTRGMTPDEINLLGTFLTVLADQIAMIAAVNNSRCEAKTKAEQDMQSAKEKNQKSEDLFQTGEC